MPVFASLERPRPWLLALALAGLAVPACDTEPEEGLFGASAAGPSMSTAGGDTAGDAEDRDTDGASNDSRDDNGAAGESTAAAGPADDSGPADSGGDPMPPPPDGETGAGTFDPLDDGGMDDAGGSTSVGDDGGASASGGGGLPGACCSPSASAGCSDPAVEACVCGGDSFCCDTQWDDVCAAAADACGGNCGGGGGGGACCMVQAGPGCADPAIEGCVCLFDSFCCEMQWDDICVEEAQTTCGAAC